MGCLECESWVSFSTNLQKLCPFLPSGCLFDSMHLCMPLELALHRGLGCQRRTKAQGFPKDWALMKCHSHRDPAAGMSLLPKPRPPLHSGCPLSGTSPNQGQSLVQSLPRYLQHPYWVRGTARDPAARLMPTAYSGGHSCQSSCPHKGQQWYVLSQRSEAFISFPIFANIQHFPTLHPFLR